MAGEDVENVPVIEVEKKIAQGPKFGEKNNT